MLEYQDSRSCPGQAGGEVGKQRRAADARQPASAANRTVAGRLRARRMVALGLEARRLEAKCFVIAAAICPFQTRRVSARIAIGFSVHNAIGFIRVCRPTGGNRAIGTERPPRIGKGITQL